MNIRDRSLVGAFFSIFGATVVGMVVSVLFTPLLVRILGPDRYGNYAFVLSVLAIAMIFANSGVTRGVKKYVAEEDRPEGWQSEVVGFYTRVSVVLVALVCLPILLLSTVDFFGLVEDRLVLYFQLMALVVVAKQLYWLAKNVLQGLGYERYSEPIRVFHRVSFAAFGLTLAYLGYGVAGVLTGYALSLALAFTIAVVILGRILDLGSVLRSHVRLPRRQLLRFNLLSVVLLFVMESLYNSDVILLRLLVGETQTGYYKAALVVAQLMWLLPKALQSLLLHSSSNYWSADEGEKIEAIGSLATRLILVTSVLMAAGLVVLADDFIPLYFGSDFAAAVGPMLLLLPGVIGFAMARPVNAIVQGSGELRVLIAATGAAAVINLGLNLLLIPLFGMRGAAAATSVGYGSMAVFSTLASRRVGFDPLDDSRIGRIALAGAISLAGMFAVDRVLPGSYVSLAIVPVVGTALYVLAVFRTGVITEREARFVTTNLPSSIASRTERIVSAIT